MKTLRHFLHPDHADIFWKISVQFGFEFLRIQFPVRVKIRALPESVNTSIGSSGPVDLHRLAQKPGQSLFYFSLNGLFRIALSLPAVVTASIIL